jgi:hypothetical protein
VPIERLHEQSVSGEVEGRRSLQKLGMTRDEDDRQPRPCRLNDSYQLMTIHYGHPDVRDQAVNLGEATAFEQRGGGGEWTNREVRRFEQTLEGVENALIIIDHGDRVTARVGHDSFSGANGITGRIGPIEPTGNDETADRFPSGSLPDGPSAVSNGNM